MERLYFLEEAAKVLRVSDWTLRSWIEQGKRRSAKVGHRSAIGKSELRLPVVDDPHPVLVTRTVRARGSV